MLREQAERLAALFGQRQFAAVLREGAPLAAAYPNVVFVRNLLGAAAAELGRIDDAVQHFSAVVRIAPDKAESHNNLGLALGRRGAYADAAACFREARRLNPADPGAAVNLGGALLALGQPEAAIESLEAALAAAPGLPMALGNLGLALKDAGRLAEAADRFREVLRTAPRDVETIVNLAAVLAEMGRTEEAVAQYEAALAIDPKNVPALRNLGVALKSLGRRDRAAECYERALTLAPGDAETLNNLGLVDMERGRKDAAVARFAAATEARPEYAAAHNNLGLALLESGRIKAAGEAFDRAMQLDPDDPNPRINRARAANSQAPLWHIAMMNDHPRNDAFREALDRSIASGDLVFEVGAGSGLLAMMAADAGAAQVVTCEAAPAVAAAAAEIVQANGFEDRVTVLAKTSNQVRIPDDLPAQADVIVAEVLSSEFVGEGVLASLDDARRRLLRPGGRMIPAGGAIMLALISAASVAAEMLRVDRVAGYDLSAFNRITSRKIDLRSDGQSVRLLSAGVPAFDFDFQSGAAPTARAVTLEIPATAAGSCLGVIQWNRVDLTDDVRYENHPVAAASHWSTPVYLFDEPLDVRAGDVVRIRAGLSADRVWFRLA